MFIYVQIRCWQVTVPWIFINLISLIYVDLYQISFVLLSFEMKLWYQDFSHVKLVATNNLLVIYNVMFNGHKMSTEPTESENVCLLTGYVSGWKTSPNLNAIVDQGYETNIHHLSQSVSQ